MRDRCCGCWRDKSLRMHSSESGIGFHRSRALTGYLCKDPCVVLFGLARWRVHTRPRLCRVSCKLRWISISVLNSDHTAEYVLVSDLGPLALPYNLFRGLVGALRRLALILYQLQTNQTKVTHCSDHSHHWCRRLYTVIRNVSFSFLR